MTSIVGASSHAKGTRVSNFRLSSHVIVKYIYFYKCSWMIKAEKFVSCLSYVCCHCFLIISVTSRISIGMEKKMCTEKNSYFVYVHDKVVVSKRKMLLVI